VASLHKTTSDSFSATCVPRRARAAARRRKQLAARPCATSRARAAEPRASGPATRSIKTLYNYVNERSGLPAPLIAPDVYEVRENATDPV
jgi:hypothetical protein